MTEKRHRLIRVKNQEGPAGYSWELKVVPRASRPFAISKRAAFLIEKVIKMRRTNGTD